MQLIDITNCCECVGSGGAWSHCDNVADQEWLLSMSGNVTSGFFTITVMLINNVSQTFTLPWNASTGDIDNVLGSTSSGGDLPNNPITIKFADNNFRVITVKSTPTGLATGAVRLDPQWSLSRIGYLLATQTPATLWLQKDCSQLPNSLFDVKPCIGGTVLLVGGVISNAVRFQALWDCGGIGAVFVNVPAGQRPSCHDFYWYHGGNINVGVVGVPLPGAPNTFAPTKCSCNPFSLTYSYQVQQPVNFGFQLVSYTVTVVLAEDLSALDCVLPISVIDTLQNQPSLHATFFAPSQLAPCGCQGTFPILRYGGSVTTNDCHCLCQDSNASLNGRSFKLTQQTNLPASAGKGWYRSDNALPVSAIHQVKRYNFQFADCPALQQPSYLPAIIWPTLVEQWDFNTVFTISPGPDPCPQQVGDPAYQPGNYIADGCDFIEVSQGFWLLEVFEQINGVDFLNGSQVMAFNASAGDIVNAINNNLPFWAQPVTGQGGPLPTSAVIIHGNSHNGAPTPGTFFFVIARTLSFAGQGGPCLSIPDGHGGWIAVVGYIGQQNFSFPTSGTAPVYVWLKLNGFSVPVCHDIPVPFGSSLFFNAIGSSFFLAPVKADGTADINKSTAVGGLVNSSQAPSLLYGVFSSGLGGYPNYQTNTSFGQFAFDVLVTV